MRVFLDTNVLVAAFATRGLCADLLRAVLVHHELIVAPVVLEELGRVLRDKIGLDESRVARALALLEPFRAEATEAAVGTLEVRDSTDIPVLEAAISCGAEVVVSGDRDLLEARVPIRVLSPRSFWEELRRARNVDEIHEP